MKITTIANTITAKLTKFLGDANEAKYLAWIIIACIYFFGMYSARKYMITFTWQQAVNDIMAITQNAIQQLGALLYKI